MPTESFLYLVTRGRKTGKPRKIEIWFVELRGSFYIIAEKREHTHWVKNVRAHPEVTFSVGSRTVQETEVPRTSARARAVDEAAEPKLAQQVQSLMQQKYGWSDGLVIEIVPSPETTS